MKRINDSALLSEKMEQYGFAQIFSSDALPFQLYRYEKGEILNFYKHFSETLVFLLEGNISIYSLRDDGSSYHVCNAQGLTLLGDIELIQNREGDFWVEARSNLLCIELPTAGCQDRLMQDNAFLRFCLRSVTKKLDRYLHSEASASGLEEKLVHYLQNSCKNSRMTGVQGAADQLHCSRRQLQRVLKKLCDAGRIEKLGKGEYRLTDAQP